MKNININFHKTFKAEGQYISSILEIADGKTWFTTREISEMTGIPQGKSSGKVEPHINYAEYMGLIKSEKEKKDGLCGSDSCNGTSVCRMRPDRDKDGEQYSGIGNRR